MELTYQSTVILGDVEIDAQVDFETRLVDNGIGAYAYGSARECDSQLCVEVERLFNFAPSEPIKNAVKREMYFRGLHKISRKRQRHFLRQKCRQVAKLFLTSNPDDFFRTSDLEEFAGCRMG